MVEKFCLGSLETALLKFSFLSTAGVVDKHFNIDSLPENNAVTLPGSSSLGVKIFRISEPGLV